MRSLSSDDSHHNVYDDDHLLAGRWVEQGVPGQLLLPLVQEQIDQVSLVPILRNILLWLETSLQLSHRTCSKQRERENIIRKKY